MSSLPQRPQLESFCEASLMAAALTVMFIFLFLIFSSVIPAERSESRDPSRKSRWPRNGSRLASLRCASGMTGALEIHLVAALEREDLARIIRCGDLQA